MDGTFRPRRVANDSWKMWFKEGLQLSVRNPIRNSLIVTVFTLPYLLVNSESDGTGFLLYLLYSLTGIPILLCTLAISSRASDLGEDFLQSVLNRNYFIGLLKVVAVYCLIIAGLILFSSLIYLFLVLIGLSGQETIVSTTGAANSVFDFRPGAFLWRGIGVYLFFGAVTWFLPGLLCLAEAPLSNGLRLAFEALSKNTFILWFPILATFVLGVLAGISGILAIPAAAIIGSMMYVSYRHVFWGKGKNQPLKARVSIGAQIHA